MSKDSRNGILGAATCLVAAASFGTAAFTVLHGRFVPIVLLTAVLVQLSMPFVVIGLCLAQRPGFAPVGQAGAITFGFGCVLTLFVALYALVAEVRDTGALAAQLDGFSRAAAVSVVPGGVAFGAATYVRGRLPRWGAACFVFGLLLIVPTVAAPEGFGLLAVGLRDLGLAGMGLAMVPAPRPSMRRGRRVVPVGTPRGRVAGPPTRPLAPGA